MRDDLRVLNVFLSEAEKVAFVEVKSTKGSTPRDGGAWMLVSENQIFQTIGGGKLENLAIEKARWLLSESNREPIEMHVPLGPQIGQCCGGAVTLHVKNLDQNEIRDLVDRLRAEIEQLPRVYVFGAGHVGQALVRALLLLPAQPVLIDTRENELAAAPDEIETRLTAVPEMEIRMAKAGAAFVILTHDHALDFLLVREALMRDDAAYVGMIGSKTKRATFQNWLRREDGMNACIEKLTCPIGGSALNDKRPSVIAARVVAEIITHLDNAARPRVDDTQPTLRVLSGL